MLQDKQRNALKQRANFKDLTFRDERSGVLKALMCLSYLLPLTIVLALSFAVPIQKVHAADTVNANTDCSTYKKGEVFEDTQCEILKLEAIEQDLAARKAINACLAKIKRALESGKVSRSELGEVTRANACNLAARFG